ATAQIDDDWSAYIRTTDDCHEDLINFEGYEIHQHEILLNWETRSTADFKLFVLERSTDAINFEVMDIVPRQLDDQLQFYQILDVNLNNGMTYYRLSNLTDDGQREVLKMISLRVSGEVFAIYPNPTPGMIYISSPSVREVEVLNESGRPMTKVIVKNDPHAIDLTRMPSGVYYIRALSDENTEVRKVRKI
ncbi:MAG: T9SS type A sorting domain-containing protein, partial [Saprospiraceae bacterium]|nr:T9SS type A sorting domain-containing protein [Saprospiraceae bacterium]